MTLRKIAPHNQEEPSQMPPLDKFKGCILGCALGDSVGAWAERRPSGEAKDYAKFFLPKFDFSCVTPHHGGMPFGQYTDDTQLTRELALSIIDEGGWDPEDFGRRIARAFEQDEIVGGGRATAEAASRLTLGVSWEESGTPPPRAGNGAAMRAGPIGLLYWNDVESLVRVACEQAVITHKAEVAVAGSIAVAAAVAMSLNASKETSGPHEPGWWNWHARFVAKYSEDFSKDIEELTVKVFGGRRHGTVAASDEEWTEIRRWCREGDQSGWDGIGPWARSSVLWSLYCVMTHPTDVWAAIGLAIMPGGDVDTTAAMVGAMVGAHVGIDKFPERAITEVAPKIHDARSSRYDWAGLEQVAEQLHETVQRRHEEEVAAQEESPTVLYKAPASPEAEEPGEPGAEPQEEAEGAQEAQATVLDMFGTRDTD